MPMPAVTLVISDEDYSVLQRNARRLNTTVSAVLAETIAQTIDPLRRQKSVHDEWVDLEARELDAISDSELVTADAMEAELIARLAGLRKRPITIGSQAVPPPMRESCQARSNGSLFIRSDEPSRRSHGRDRGR
jgi:hypothetical protein